MIFRLWISFQISETRWNAAETSISPKLVDTPDLRWCLVLPCPPETVVQESLGPTSWGILWNLQIIKLVIFQTYLWSYSTTHYFSLAAGIL